MKPFLDKNKFNCFAQWQLIDSNYERPLLAVQHVRNLKKSMPYKCKSIFLSLLVKEESILVKVSLKDV